MSRSEAVCPASASSAYTAVVATALCSWRSSKAAPQAMPSPKCHTQLEPKRCDLPFELRELQISRMLQMSQGPDLPLRPPKDWKGRGAICVTSVADRQLQGANFTMVCRVQSSKNYFTLAAEKRPGIREPGQLKIPDRALTSARPSSSRLSSRPFFPSWRPSFPSWQPSSRPWLPSCQPGRCSMCPEQTQRRTERGSGPQQTTA